MLVHGGGRTSGSIHPSSMHGTVGNRNPFGPADLETARDDRIYRGLGGSAVKHLQGGAACGSISVGKTGHHFLPPF